MHPITEQKLKAISDSFFSSVTDPAQRNNIELMYQAFKARLMYELRVDGGTNQGVVYGHLETR